MRQELWVVLHITGWPLFIIMHVHIFLQSKVVGLGGSILWDSFLNFESNVVFLRAHLSNISPGYDPFNTIYLEMV